MASVSLSNLHPDFKLGLLLVVAAALLAAGSSIAFLYTVAHDQLDVGASEFGWITLAGGLGGLVVVPAVIWVDSRPPHVMISARSLVLAIGLALSFLSDTLVFAVPTAFVAGAGGAAVGSLIFYVVVVSGMDCTPTSEPFPGRIPDSAGLAGRSGTPSSRQWCIAPCHRRRCRTWRSHR